LNPNIKSDTAGIAAVTRHIKFEHALCARRFYGLVVSSMQSRSFPGQITLTRPLCYGVAMFGTDAYRVRFCLSNVAVNAVINFKQFSHHTSSPVSSHSSKSIIALGLESHNSIRRPKTCTRVFGHQPNPNPNDTKCDKKVTVHVPVPVHVLICYGHIYEITHVINSANWTAIEV
jgi:hypothetical protein